MIACHITDTHFTDYVPVHRRDDYVNVLLEKARRCWQRAGEIGADFMIHTGDFFTRQRIHNFRVMGEIADIIDSAPFPTFACLGEHDLYGHNPGTLSESSLGFILRFSKNLKIINEPVVFGSAELHAKHEWQKMETAASAKTDKSRFRILLCHELLTNKKMAYGTTDTASLDLPFDLVCSGDLHQGYPTHKVGNTWYVNPGSMARQNTGDKRHPKMAIIDFDVGCDPIIKDFLIDTARPYNEVFGIGTAETVKKMESSVGGSSFANSLRAFSAEKTDIYRLIEEAYQTSSVNEGVEGGIPDDVMAYLEGKKKKFRE